MTAPENEQSSRGGLPWYLSTQSAWFGALGCQMVLFPYLSAVVLGLDARYVGIAQLALQGPALVFMLFGGALADQADKKHLLIQLHIIATLPPMIMALVIWSGGLTFNALVIYAIAMGTLTSFATPARDALLNQIVDRANLPRAVAAANIAQFTAQLVGMMVASSAGQVGPAPLILLQGISIATGIYFIRQIHAPREAHAKGALASSLANHLHNTVDGLREISKSKVMAPVLICNFAVGMLFVGSFLVIMPIMVRDYYHGGSFQLALMNVGFWIGTIASAVYLMRRGNINRRGRALMLALTTGTCFLASMSIPMPFAVLFTLMIGWGVGGGIMITVGRTVVQEAAPASHRARVLAAFQLGFMGGGPLGAFSIGFIVDRFGAHTAALFPAAGMIITLVALRVFTKLWTLEARHCVLVGEAEEAALQAE